ncbi:RES family NAD+ phosphorylase [Fimbriimonas ginsengisoli]|uniref:RES domain-containing protein n=1 Tax=Fimbriimonas ginsengisoli Gsoil 348 TaxID=661478 RepID=A0A068NUE9_FIMGI|nr:RES domain-containing protein [Fimbriimonas ginsengisoli]AIE87148.1 hypothetical protein OP10G_3780 [Fimbriimonas ginsengisoli Gsoil 348]
MTCFLIADRRYSLLSGMGAALYGGRWNSVGSEMLYTSLTFAGAILEKLVHTNTGSISQTQAWIRLEVPSSLPIHAFEEDDISDWLSDQAGCRNYGDKWLISGASVGLIVPSIIGRPHEMNLLLNPKHPGFGEILTSEPAAVDWDPRLFSR